LFPSSKRGRKEMREVKCNKCHKPKTDFRFGFKFCSDCDNFDRHRYRYIGKSINSDSIHFNFVPSTFYGTSKEREELYQQSMKKDVNKHSNESCSSCNKPINFDEWFCYRSLCPDCYLQIPEEEIEKLDEELDIRLASTKEIIARERNE
jgi:hypothetical protein